MHHHFPPKQFATALLTTQRKVGAHLYQAELEKRELPSDNLHLRSEKKIENVTKYYTFIKELHFDSLHTQVV